MKLLQILSMILKLPTKLIIKNAYKIKNEVSKMPTKMISKMPTKITNS